MSALHTVHTFAATLAAEGHGELNPNTGNHESLNAYAIGGGALATLLFLLIVVTRFNRDR
ncbi:LPXTG cell wall anchor domain-containing protein [Streptomyces boninensis]|uniref:LPXTG cell wall anchor domain-containing protein n=1 Tax=Streptomyces boninensis TaxID=2039455 RepID=UPI003B224D55